MAPLISLRAKPEYATYGMGSESLYGVITLEAPVLENADQKRAPMSLSCVSLLLVLLKKIARIPNSNGGHILCPSFPQTAALGTRICPAEADRFVSYRADDRELLLMNRGYRRP